jgi:hypothetical protein
MADTVLRCKPDRLARSARDIGLWRRMKLSAMRRLIWRAVSLVATRKLVRSIFAHPFPADLEVVSGLQDYFVSVTNDIDAMPVCQLIVAGLLRFVGRTNKVGCGEDAQGSGLKAQAKKLEHLLQGFA